MCLILLANRVIDEAELVVAANRDEFYARPASPAQRWAEWPQVFGGRDLEAGGTWFGVSTSGRFAAVTNFTETLEGTVPPGSRGALPHDFLIGDESARQYAQHIDPARYRGFNLLLSDGEELLYTSNRRGGITPLSSGVYGLSNTDLDTHWPKTSGGAAALRVAIAQREFLRGDLEPLLAILADESIPPDEELPNRGRDLAFERRVAPRFIRGEEYGTRASTVLVIRRDRILLHERLFGPNGQRTGDTSFTLPRI